MRIISGKYKGRRIDPPAKLPVRPTTDFAKEGLFNVLNNLIDFEGLEALDLFAGSGNISLELISRGCASVTAVEQNYNNIKFIKAISEKLGEKNIHTVLLDVFRFIGFCNQKFDLIFADPPFDLDNSLIIPKIIFEKKLLKNKGLLVIEHPDYRDFSEHPAYIQTRKYGKVHFSFFENRETSSKNIV